MVGATDPVQDLDSAASRIAGLLNDDGHVTDGKPSRAATGDVADDRAARAAAQARDERGKFRRDGGADDEDDEAGTNARAARRQARQQQEQQNSDDAADDDRASDRDDEQEDEADTDAGQEQSEGDEAGEESGETDTIETLSQLAEALELDQDELMASIKHKFKAAGEDVEVTLAELVKGYQKDADYRRSTARLAEERRAFEQQAQQRADEFVKAQHVAAQQMMLAEQLFSNMLNSQELARLRETDPSEWAAKRDELARTVGWLQQQRQQAAAAYDAWRSGQLRQLRDREMQALREAVPDWGENHRIEVRNTLKSLDFSDEEIGLVFDSRLIRGALELSNLRAENQRLKERIAKAEEAAKRVRKDVPRFTKPGKQRSGGAGTYVNRGSLAKLKGRLRQTGDVRDAAAVIEHMM